MAGGRKGFYEELMKKEQLQELTVKMVNHANKVMAGEDEARKDAMTHKILPKIIDKAIPTQITGEEGEAIKIAIEVSKEGSEKYKLYENSGTDKGDTA